ncbi:hypothetical protein J6590_056992, partial [Homalodisca vitripennis]
LRAFHSPGGVPVSIISVDRSDHSHACIDGPCRKKALVTSRRPRAASAVCRGNVLRLLLEVRPEVEAQRRRRFSEMCPE